MLEINNLKKTFENGGPALKGVDLKIIPILGNINDELKFEKVCKKYHIDTIYHAAAYKHVTLVEHNPSIAVTNNIFSTLSIASDFSTSVVLSIAT